ncbi:large ribosomal subunit protein uL23m-like [Ruditapes philippinarum]|uniref:large ribosomal subunit protein uL23m-like n=1 Tax=Ruditapes philippinarum TaxID=129788 RepID=UPI00295C228F|nr:large ribosomal subunit protein uL23m-like [Ruditapes philippinarum]
MASKIAKNLTRIPLWKREIPRPPLYYKGDEKRQEFLPLFWMKIIPPELKMPKNIVSFIVHPQMNKHDIAQYLEKIYNVPVLHVRTELRVKDIYANSVERGKLQGRKYTITKEEEKYAYVHLADGTFSYPDFFSSGGQAELTKQQLELEALEKAEGKFIAGRGSEGGIPLWFTGRKNKDSRESLMMKKKKKS